ncbi:MAG: GNAT family N-acetyltransferase [Deltaproteobacteria bacterium]
MKGSSLQIRHARPEDDACLARLNATLHAEHLRERPDFFKPTSSEEVAGWFRALLEKPTTRCWIAESDGDAVGYLLMREYQRPENTFCLARHWHEIDHVGVEAAFRGRGIGRTLVQTALAAAAASGAREVELASWSFNTSAHAMFRRCGFVPRLLRFDSAVGG